MRLVKSAAFFLSKWTHNVQGISSRSVHCPSTSLFAGHSKWANIKHIKAEKDGQKATLFTRIARQIRLAIQEGGSADPALNAQLRTVVDDAVRKNMPMASIQNNIKKFQQSPAQLKKFVLELRYKQKVFVVCILYTDNLAGLKMNIATILRKFGAVQTDISHMFEDFGLIEAKLDVAELKGSNDLEERVTEDAIECGAEEVEIIDSTNGIINFTCSPNALNALRNALEKKAYTIESTEHIYVAKNTVELTADEEKTYDVFLQKLRDIQGVEDIYDNVEN